MAKLQFKTGRLEPRWLLPTGSYSLNRALGGGLQSGRFHVFWGSKGSTKSTNALYAIANAQKMGKTCAYVDAEKSLDDGFPEKCGVDVDAMLYADEGTNLAESLLETVLPELDKGNIQVLVIDSLSSVLQESFFKKPEANPIGIYARSAKFVIAKLLNALSRDMQIILISHASMDFSGYVPMLTAQMGNAQAHWTSNIIRFTANDGKANFRDDGYRKVTWKFNKTKQPVDPREGQFYFNGRTADIDYIDELVTIAVEAGLVEKTSINSSWLTYDGVKYHGEANFAEAARNDEDLYISIDQALAEYDAENRNASLVDTEEFEEFEEDDE